MDTEMESARQVANGIGIFFLFFAVFSGAVLWLQGMRVYERSMKNYFQRNRQEDATFDALVRDIPPEARKASFEHPWFTPRDKRTSVRIKN